MWWIHRETEIVIFFFRYCDVLYLSERFLEQEGRGYINIERETYCNLYRIFISGHH